MMSEVFWIGFYSSLFGLILAVGAQYYKSKCKQVDICCIKITRDVEGEEEIDKQQHTNPIQSRST